MPDRSTPARVAVGEVVGCHGLRGELKVRLLTDDPARFGELGRVFLGEGAEAREILAHRVHKGHVLLTLDGVGDRDAAEALRGQVLTIPAGERRELEDGRFYHDDLVGLRVVDASGEEVGEVTGFDEHSGAGILEVRMTGGGRLDIPFANAWVPEIDVPGGTLTVAPRWRQLIDPDE